MAKKLDKLSKEEVKHLDGVVEGTLNYYIQNVFPWIYDIIKMKTWYTKDIECQIKKIDPEWDSSYYVYPILEPNNDSFVANSYEIDTIWRPVAIKATWANIVRDASDYLSWVESITNWKEVEDMMRTEATPIWTSYCRFWYKNTDNGKLPSAQHVSFFELFVEPGARDFYDARYKIYRKIQSENQIVEMYGDKLVTEKVIKKMKETQWDCFKSRDFNKIRELKFYESEIEAYIASVDQQVTPTELFTNALANQFMVIDKENGNHELIEVRDGGKCHVYINREYMFSYDDFSQTPFGCFVFEKQPGTYLGRGLGHKLMPSQLEANFLYNSLRRAIRQDVFPDTMTIPGALTDPVTGQSPVELSHKWGKNYNLNPSASFWGRAFEKIAYTAQDTMSLLMTRLNWVIQEAQMIAGTSSYTMGGQGKVERVAGGVAQKNSVFLARLQPMTASIKAMKARAFHMWLEIAKRIDKDLIFSISESGKETTIKDLAIDDILNKTYVWIDMETNKSIKRYENVQLGTTILSVLSPFAALEEAKPYMLQTLKQVLKDYAFEWDGEKMESTTNEWKENLQWILDQIKTLEANNQWVDTMWQNALLSGIMSNTPVDAGTSQQPLQMDF